MNTTIIFTLRAFRKLYQKYFGLYILYKPECDQDPNSVNHKIITILSSNQSGMIGRFGANELSILTNYINIKSKSKNIIDYIKGENPGWWWDQKTISCMGTNAGFFPLQINKIVQFCELMLHDIPQVDVLGSWLPEEHYFRKSLQKCQKVNIELLNPYFSEPPWTMALEGKKVLVVHPFAKTIEIQYKKRKLLFKGNLLPEFNLKTIKAVQSIAGEKTVFTDWFEALEFMKAEIDKVDYDICLIGCGAYGFPLAAHVKRMGKKGFHLGGSLQLLFGIKGKRWENENYNEKFNYSKLMNEHWIKPDHDETPKNALKVENGTYW